MIDQPFCIEDQFYRDLESFVMEASESGVFGDTQEWLDEIPDDWTQKVEMCDKEKMFAVDEDDVEGWIEKMLDYHEDRVSENDMSEELKKAFMAGIDLQKINSEIPELWYSNGTVRIITKQDIIDSLTPAPDKVDKIE